MSDDNSAVIDQKLADELSGGEKLKILLKKKAGSLADWARGEGVNPAEIHQTLSGYREYPEHRERIARALDLDRSTVDRMLGTDRAA